MNQLQLVLFVMFIINHCFIESASADKKVGTASSLVQQVALDAKAQQAALAAQAAAQGKAAAYVLAKDAAVSQYTYAYEIEHPIGFLCLGPLSSELLLFGGRSKEGDAVLGVYGLDQKTTRERKIKNKWIYDYDYKARLLRLLKGGKEEESIILTPELSDDTAKDSDYVISHEGIKSNKEGSQLDKWPEDVVPFREGSAQQVYGRFITDKLVAAITLDKDRKAVLTIWQFDPSGQPAFTEYQKISYDGVVARTYVGFRATARGDAILFGSYPLMGISCHYCLYKLDEQKKCYVYSKKITCDDCCFTPDGDQFVTIRNTRDARVSVEVYDNQGNLVQSGKIDGEYYRFFVMGLYLIVVTHDSQKGERWITVFQKNKKEAAPKTTVESALATSS